MSLGIGRIHFVGIGGIGMSGMAEILHNLGYDISGSDQQEGPILKRLRTMGVAVHVGHEATHIQEATVVVKSTAVPLSNPEIIAAKQHGIPVIRRSAMLAEIARLKATIAVAGSHGKTTTTSLIASLLSAANMDPTVINGGIINAYGANAHLGSGDWLVAEADESDGTFLKIPATIGVVTNIDPEHLDYWGSYVALKEGFLHFIEQIPFYGASILCVDDPAVRGLAEHIQDRRIITYAIGAEEAMWTAQHVHTTDQGVCFDIYQEGACFLKEVTLCLPGQHNIANALAATAAGHALGIAPGVLQEGLEHFAGVKRRFTLTGTPGGVHIIDDYAHHPTEVQATLAAARTSMPKEATLWAILQPHRYSRLEALFTDFCEALRQADHVLISDVYAAGEPPIEGVSGAVLAKALQEAGMRAAYIKETPQGMAHALAAYLLAQGVQSGDRVLCMGAGDNTTWSYALPAMLDHVTSTT